MILPPVQFTIPESKGGMYSLNSMNILPKISSIICHMRLCGVIRRLDNSTINRQQQYYVTMNN
ncbi:hypothetical protein T12_2321 [Trichinella patagoniensis]|uniref:Uncharacterized protein n=1 Tax=Trichinella patagoniensis TaxID=990121 RepID=A0A0V1A2V8_9BILA|nr:hypothetical protein T12_2321 [Trichinella patagoniensis]